MLVFRNPLARCFVSSTTAFFPALFKRLLVARPASVRLEEGQRVYAVGDIHGRADLLAALLEKIRADAGDRPSTLIFLGDYVDRGPASKEVVELLLNLDWPGWEIVCLRGNHEETLLQFLRDPDTYLAWRPYGAADTLWSYGVKPPSFSSAAEILRAQEDFAAKLPRRHLAFFMELPFTHSVGGYYFAHAGVRPGIALHQQRSEDLLWIRDEFLLSDASFGKVVVHGHSPSEEPVVRRNRIGIDTGAYATHRLTAVRLAGDGVTFLTAQGSPA